MQTMIARLLTSATLATLITGALAGALSRLMVVVERYPELKANENMARVMEELSSTENRIGFSRQHYNDSVMTYNTKTEVFPASVVAGMFNFEQKEFFELSDEGERAVPKVSF